MSSSEKPTLTIEVAGESVNLIPPGFGWTFREAELAMAETGGMSPVEVEERTYVADPRAWRAVLLVSFQRAGRPLPNLEDVDLLELVDKATAALEGAAEKEDPTKTPSSSSDASESENSPTLDLDSTT